MESYCIIFKIKPEFQSDDPHSVAVAFAAVYVFCDTEKEAETRAINHLNQHDWEILKTETVSEMTPKLIAQMNETSAKCYLDAKSTGISFEILDVWPKFLDRLYYPKQSLSAPNKENL